MGPVTSHPSYPSHSGYQSLRLPVTPVTSHSGYQLLRLPVKQIEWSNWSNRSNQSNWSYSSTLVNLFSILDEPLKRVQSPQSLLLICLLFGSSLMIRNRSNWMIGCSGYQSLRLPVTPVTRSLILLWTAAEWWWPVTPIIEMFSLWRLIND